MFFGMGRRRKKKRKQTKKKLDSHSTKDLTLWEALQRGDLLKKQSIHVTLSVPGAGAEGGHGSPGHAC